MAARAVDEIVRPIGAYVARHGGWRATAAAKEAVPNGVASAAPAAKEDWRFELVRSVGEECQTDAELRSLLQRKAEFNLYDGFEPSGRMHIAQGVFKGVNVNKCTKAGGIFIFWVADWFALMNDKMGGDLEKIKTVGQYFIEVWKATGMDMTRVRFHWSSDDIAKHAKEYWGQALDIARHNTIPRVKKCCQIMGRKEDKLTAAQIMYPIMQSADIFFLKADVCQLGVDQRKVNMLARDYCDSAGRKNKPVILSHHMIYGLTAGQAKMSKSNPESAIFMEDTPADVERKIRNAYCPLKPEEAAVQAAADEDMQLEKDDLMNPCLDYLKHILFSREGFVLKAGGKTYQTFEEAKASFLAGAFSEKDLKDVLIQEINGMLDPVRKHFKNDPTARDLLAKITEWKKETLVPPSGLVRLKPKPAFAKEVFVVFAPMPSEAVQFEAVLSVLKRLKQAPPGAEKVLWLEDWSAASLGFLGGSESCIKGWYELLLFGLRSYAPDLMKGVRVCWQEDMILSGPSDYWISVINTGRKCTLEDIRKSLPQGAASGPAATAAAARRKAAAAGGGADAGDAGESNDAGEIRLEVASQVFVSLMHVADVLSLSDASSITLCCDQTYHRNLHSFAADQFKALGLKMPTVKVVETSPLRLMQVGEGVEAEVNIMLSDKEVEVNKKVKKSFCQPENVEFNPPIAWVSEILAFNSKFVVARKPDNGGDRTYTDVASLTQEFASGALHPGDLKPALSKAINAVLEPLREGLAKQDVLKKAQKDLDSYVKAQSKKK